MLTTVDLLCVSAACCQHKQKMETNDEDVHASNASTPFSLPIPLSFMPPLMSRNKSALHVLDSGMCMKATNHGELGSLRWCVLTHTRPASISAETRCAFDKSCVQMPAPSPYLHALASSTPSRSL